MNHACCFAVVAMFVIPLLSACAANKPRIAVERAAWTEQTDEAALLHIDVEIANPSSQPMQVREMRYIVHLNGERVYWGRRSTAQTIAPGDSVWLSIPAVVSVEDLAEHGGANALSMDGSLVYITPGRMALVMRDLGLPPLRRDFTGEAPIAATR